MKKWKIVSSTPLLGLFAMGLRFLLCAMVLMDTSVFAQSLGVHRDTEATIAEAQLKKGDEDLRVSQVEEKPN